MLKVFARSQAVTYRKLQISETVQDRDVLPHITNSKWCMTYRTAAIQMMIRSDVTDLQGRSSIVSIFKLSFCTVVQQLKRFQLTQRVARSLCNSWPSCYFPLQYCEENIHGVSKNDTALTCYYFDVHQPILIIFGRNVAKKVGSQMVLYFLTSTN